MDSCNIFHYIIQDFCGVVGIDDWQSIIKCGYVTIDDIVVELHDQTGERSDPMIGIAIHFSHIDISELHSQLLKINANTSTFDCGYFGLHPTTSIVTYFGHVILASAHKGVELNHAICHFIQVSQDKLHHVLRNTLSHHIPIAIEYGI